MRKPKAIKSLLNLPLIFYIQKIYIYLYILERKPEAKRKLHKKGYENLASIRKVGPINFKIQKKTKRILHGKNGKHFEKHKTQTFKNT